METAILEAPIAPERENTSPSPEFSRRILLAPTNKDALNPTIPLTPTTRESLGTIAERNYTIFNTHSTQERSAYWSTKPEQTNAAQMDAWLTGTQATFANGREFFTSSAQGKQWSEVYKKLGLSPDNIQRDSLQQFYTKYLTAQNPAQDGVKQFVKDILASPAYRTPDGKFDAMKLEQDLPAITWLANVFGEKSSEIISSLTAAEGIVQENPDTLVTNTDTTLSTRESELLESLGHAVPTPPVEQPIPEPQTPTTPEQTSPVTQTPAETTPPAQVTQPTPVTEPLTQATTPQPSETHTPTASLPITTTPVTEPTPARNPAPNTTPVTTPTLAETQPAAPQTREIDPKKDLSSQVNEALKTASTPTMRFEATPDSLTTYLKTIKPSKGKLNEISANIVNGKLVIHGELGVFLGKATFSATLANNTTGGIMVESHTLKLEGTANAGRGAAEDYIQNMNSKIVDLINSKVDQAWRVSGMHIADNKLGMEFAKK